MAIKDKDCVIVYADGSNEVTIPVTVFKDLATCKQVLTELTGKKPKECMIKNIKFCSENKEKVLVWEVDEDNPVFGHTDEEDDEDEESQDKLFEYSYFGCGGPSHIIARPIKFGELKLFVYDLD